MTRAATGSDIQTPNDESEIVKPPNVVVANAQQVAEAVRVSRFRGRPMLLEHFPFPHYVPLHREKFDSIAYPLLGGVTRSRMADVFAYLSNTVEDLTDNDHLILFGVEDPNDASLQDYYHSDASSKVWDMRALEWVEATPDVMSQSVWRSPHGAITEGQPIPFILSLAGNDMGKYDDIMQSLAPMVMAKKPDGVVWWVGDGANGKSTLMDAIYRLFPGQLSSITVKRLVDGRDTPSLNGTLANIVKESSEGRIDDTEIYKAIGTHEDFRVHKFHSQDDIRIRGNLHHIFSANSIPVFNDKGFSARRRTFIVPFTQRFESDPTFEERTFTNEMFGRLIAEMCKYAQRLRDQGYKYKFSASTLAAKEEYDTEANNAEEYAGTIIEQGVVAFGSFSPVQMDYQNWCADMGYVPLGINNLRRALQTVGFERVSVRTGDTTGKMYRLRTIPAEAELQPMSMMRPGMFTTPGFQPTPSEKAPVPDFSGPTTEDIATEEPPQRRPSTMLKDWSK